MVLNNFSNYGCFNLIQVLLISVVSAIKHSEIYFTQLNFFCVRILHLHQRFYFIVNKFIAQSHHITISRLQFDRRFYSTIQHNRMPYLITQQLSFQSMVSFCKKSCNLKTLHGEVRSKHAITGLLSLQTTKKIPFHFPRVTLSLAKQSLN